MARNNEPAIFTITFTKGDATRNRLPLSHVLSVLREIDFMIRDIGVKIQRDSGMQNPTGDFGIELLTGAESMAFLKGSVKAKAVPTRDIDNAIQAITRVIHTTNLIEKKAPVSVDEYGAPILRHLAQITKVQEKDKTELHLELKTKGKIAKSVFAETGMQAVKRMTASDFQVEGLTVYGKLKGLTDRSRVEEDDDIWGELVEENGYIWRIKFKPTDIDKAKKLFTRQVAAIGNASYFRANTPRLDVEDIQFDAPADYLKGFDEFSSNYESILGDQDAQELINDIRG
jgi:hypothetical protein